MDVFIHHQSIFLVFEFMQTDLEAVVLDKSIPLSAADIKCYMRMLLLSVETCHKHYILHRVRTFLIWKIFYLIYYVVTNWYPAFLMRLQPGY